MRRGITLLVLLFAILIGMQNKINFVQSDSMIIPEEAIRLRIIPNSNEENDQELKLKVRDEVINTISNKIKDVDNKDEARIIIYDSLEEINEVIGKVLIENDMEMTYYVDYGLTNFPAKVYNNKLYPAGNYESVYIQLGDGRGENWWCVLFPPLCLVDLAVGEDKLSETTEVKYSFLIVEKIKEFFGNK